ncbi:MBL fold metallo-hydrolase [Aggregatilineales bacterium SYSU G02658]
MLLRYFYDDRLAQASYMVGCARTGEALIVDPMRHIQPYLDAARKEGLRITHIAETHIHADFVSGARELAAATGAQVYLSDMGPAEWKYAYADDPHVILVRDGDRFMVGNIRIDVLHTPGHTPEHISFMVTDTAGADKPMGVFTGDFIFVGDVGRPDLLEEAAGYAGTKVPGAKQQFASVQQFKALPDYLQIWPGHGAGSACGKALGAIPSTTLGYEKLFNPAFQFTEEAAFVDWLLSGQPEAPRYFAQMKHVNKVGPALLRDLPTPSFADRAALEALLADGAFVADLRPTDDYAAAHLVGTISLPASSSSYLTYLGWLVDYQRPAHFILADARQLADVLIALRSIGVDHVPTVFTADVIQPQDAALPTMSADELAERLPQNGLVVLDVRNESEYCERHIAGAQHIMLGRIPQRLSDIPRDHTIVTQCASGYRSQIAASLLRAHGYDKVVNLRDGVAAWSAALPTEGC